jgi:DNA-directed RNA polymerase specialized sigma24 family protein
MAATTPIVEGHSFEEVVRLHAERFAAYLRGMLGFQAEGRGGRVPVDDTLQDALLAIYSEWPELRDVRDDERDRRMYRCLRDAAGRALRAELGRRGSETSRPQLVSLDRLMLSLDDDAPARDRELTASLLGTMVQDMSAGETARDARMTLNRGILVAGLRALTEREAVVLIAVDYLGWDQQQLSERLDLGYSSVRQTLFAARKIFYTLVRHAAGVEVDDEERARLVAFLSGELRGAEKREVARHLRHCKACQDLQREMDAFGGRAVAVLAPLPFLFGAKVLVKKSSVKAATVGSGAGTGLLTQPGAAKAVAVVVGLLSVGVGGSAVLAQLDQRHHVGPAPPPALKSEGGFAQPLSGGMRRVTTPSNSASSSSRTGSSSASSRKATTKKKRKAKNRSRSSASATTRQPTTTTQPATGQTTTQAATPPTSNNQSKSTGGTNDEFFGHP